MCPAPQTTFWRQEILQRMGRGIQGDWKHLEVDGNARGVMMRMHLNFHQIPPAACIHCSTKQHPITDEVKFNADNFNLECCHSTIEINKLTLSEKISLRKNTTA